MTHVEPAAMKDALGAFPTGVTVVTVGDGDDVHGATVASFLGVSLTPPIVLVSLQLSSLIAARIGGRNFSISVLSDRQGNLARHFAGQGEAANSIRWIHQQRTLLSDAAAHVHCTPWSTQEVGDHLLVMGLVSDANVFDRKPLLYHKGSITVRLNENH